MNWAVISVGSNVNKEENVKSAVRLLAQRCRILAVSPVYETLPAGLPEQPNFLNAAVLIETELEPDALKRQVLARIEQSLKRVRTSDKNAPRTIDLDLALFNGETREYDGHCVPDPDLLRFAHVAVPIADLLPEMPHPETGEPLRTIAQRLTVQGVRDNDGEPLLWPRPDISLEPK